MSEQPVVTENVAHQLIVPAYVWHDNKQRGAALVRIGIAMRELAARTGETVDIANATVEPRGLKADVAHVEYAGEDVAFVGYDLCAPEGADLIMITVSAPVVPA